MSRRFIATLRPKVEDDLTDGVIRKLQEQVAELQRIPFLRGRRLQVVLEDGVETAVPHGLGRKASLWTAIPSQATSGATTGRLLDITVLRAATVDTKTTSILLASGFTETLTLDVWAY